jgi:hypothetical protein
LNPTNNPPDLKGLRDIQTPEAVSWMPQTTAWYVLFALAGIVLLLAALRFWIKWKRDAYRREALKELQAIEAQCGDASGRLACLARVPQLLRRTALASSARPEVAGLTGDDWLSYLERTAPGCGLAAPAGRLMLVVAYAPASDLAGVTENDARALIAGAKAWIRRHRAGV